MPRLLYSFTPCPIEGCDHKTLYPAGLKEHIMRKHTKNVIKPHTCRFCESKFLTKGDLTQHMASRHNINVKWKYCDECNKRADPTGGTWLLPTFHLPTTYNFRDGGVTSLALSLVSKMVI